jgi:uncharacterized protein YqjF (DUF2071 family)
MDRLLRNVLHRPWPLPAGPWIMKQTWHDLLFAHWPIPPNELRPLVPSQLTLDTFEGQCWIGLVPFWMRGVRARGLPPLHGLSRFPELNVRTYVTYDGKPGVYFFSLDAANRAAVWSARTFYHLPYFHATMTATEQNGLIAYSCLRRSQPAEFRATYQPASPVRIRPQGSLEDFLTARFCLYTTHRNQVYRFDIHHLPWPLQDAEAQLERNSMTAPATIALPPSPPLLHFSKRLEVLIWPLHRAEQTVSRV